MNLICNNIFKNEKTTPEELLKYINSMVKCYVASTNSTQCVGILKISLMSCFLFSLFQGHFIGAYVSILVKTTNSAANLTQD